MSLQRFARHIRTPTNDDESDQLEAFAEHTTPDKQQLTTTTCHTCDDERKDRNYPIAGHVQFLFYHTPLRLQAEKALELSADRTQQWLLLRNLKCKVALQSFGTVRFGAWTRTPAGADDGDLRQWTAAVGWTTASPEELSWGYLFLPLPWAIALSSTQRCNMSSDDGA